MAAAGFFLAGCAATKTYAPEDAPDFVVIRDGTPFYRLGPQQSRGPDSSLSTGSHVKLLRKEMGYSLVQLTDLRTGYVANENMAAASANAPEKRDTPTTPPGKKKKPRPVSQEEAIPQGDAVQVDDSPLPFPTPPSPDLNAEPEVVPENTPAPAPKPPDAPKFRY